MSDDRNRLRDLSGISTRIIPFSVIEAGEVDANVEHINAIRRKTKPIYIGAYTQPPNFSLDRFVKGEKHVILGQKGTGKTAILRNIQEIPDLEGWKTDYMIFRDTVLEEQELATTPFHLVIDKTEFRKSTFYHHALKRLFMCVMIKLFAQESGFSVPQSRQVNTAVTERASDFCRIAQELSIGEHVSLVADSLVNDVKDVQKILNINRNVTDGDIIRVLKSINDVILTNLCNQIRVTGQKVALFIDELHFAYANEVALRDDATLVKDTILALMAINDRMARENLPGVIFSGVRSEYLTHPIIAQTELTTRLESVGERLGWETLHASKNHPLFIMAQNRIAVGLVQNGMDVANVHAIAASLVDRLFANGPQVEFLRHTWGKPRDLVRFLKIASKHFGEKTTLAKADFSAIMRQVSIESWGEMKSALSSFLTLDGLARLEAYISSHSSQSLESDGYCAYNIFERSILKCIGEEEEYHLQHIMTMLYMIGLFTTVRPRSGKDPIRHSFHRGQPNADRQGNVALHFLVAKAFS